MLKNQTKVKAQSHLQIVFIHESLVQLKLAALPPWSFILLAEVALSFQENLTPILRYTGLIGNSKLALSANSCQSVWH